MFFGHKKIANINPIKILGILFLFILFFQKSVYGAQILTTTISGNEMKVWINSKDNAIGVLSRLIPFYDQKEEQVYAFYLCGRENYTDAIVFGDYDLKKYSYFGSLLKTEGDELTEILRKAYETAEKADKLGVEVNKTVKIGHLAGNYMEVLVELRPCKSKYNNYRFLRCYMTFKNKSKTGLKNAQKYEVYFDQLLFVEMLYKHLAEHRDTIEKLMPVIEKMLKERENIKQQMEQ
jgi:hypothetical protein